MSRCFSTRRTQSHSRPPTTNITLGRSNSPFDPDHRFTRLLYPAMKKVAEAQWRTSAEMRCTAVAIACERYRMATGRWPAALNDLTPKHLSAVPRDPFDSEPLRMKRTNDGLTVYSIGLNRLDDEGDTRGPGKPDALDEGFRLWDVKERRKPAPPKPPEPKAEP